MIPGAEQLLGIQNENFPESYRPVIIDTIAFIKTRIDAAEQSLNRAKASTGEKDFQITAHMFFRECWDCLNGTGRAVNCILYKKFCKECKLYDPLNMTRQCTFYNVRRSLCKAYNNNRPLKHPAAYIIVKETLLEPVFEYRMLSFLHNLSLFMPLPVVCGESFAGYEDLPAHVKNLVKTEDISAVPAIDTMDSVMLWIGKFVNRVLCALCSQA